MRHWQPGCKSTRVLEHLVVGMGLCDCLWPSRGSTWLPVIAWTDRDLCRLSPQSHTQYKTEQHTVHLSLAVALRSL